MTQTLVFQMGLLVILAAFAGYAIPTLIQVRKTAKAVEDMVRDVQPRILGATTSLDSVLGRTDRVMEGVESGARGISGAVTSLSSFLGNLKVPLKGINKGPATMAALANFITGAWQAWAAFSKEKEQVPDGSRGNPTDANGGSEDGR